MSAWIVFAVFAICVAAGWKFCEWYEEYENWERENANR